MNVPTVLDRCMQAVVKNALDPEWEARVEPCSYGCRPGRSSPDAMDRIDGLSKPNKRKTWVVDADIEGAFDHLCQQTIEEVVKGFPAQPLIKPWLKTGVVDHGVFTHTISGTPQGGVISPLLLNLTLHGMESAMGVTYKKNRASYPINSKRALVRYADGTPVQA